MSTTTPVRVGLPCRRASSPAFFGRAAEDKAKTIFLYAAKPQLRNYMKSILWKSSRTSEPAAIGKNHIGGTKNTSNSWRTDK
jgi:hypothetical protein